MKAWWDRLNERERWMLIGGGTLLLILLLYAMLWQPFQTKLKGLRQTVAQQRTDLAWMQQAAREIKFLEGANSASRTAPVRDGRSLLTLADQTAKEAGLGSAVKRVEPYGENQVRVQLDQVNFDKMILWIGTLQQRHGVSVANVVIDRQSESGLVNARLILQGITS